MKNFFPHKNKFGKVSSKASGYTIIETMISVSLFLVVVTMGVGTLLNANLVHQKSQDMRSVMDNLSFVMDDMSRNLRTGYNYRCYGDGDDIIDDSSISTPKSCLLGGGGVAFEQQNGQLYDDPNNPVPGQYHDEDQWAYYMGTCDGKFGICKLVDEEVIQLIPDEVKIDPLSEFIVSGAEVGGPEQPFIIIKLIGKIEIESKNLVTPFSLQTSVSQRRLDR